MGKPKGKGKGGPKTVTKEEKRDIFFTFFKPPVVDQKKKDKNEDEDEDDEALALLNEDFDIGLNIKEKLISKAVLYFTGEAEDIDIDEDFDDEEIDEDDDLDD